MSGAREHTIKAAMSVARDVADGNLAPASLDQVVVSECRALFGTVTGPDDPLWDLHVEIARQVLARGGVPADELSEWVAVARSRTEAAEERFDTNLTSSDEERVSTATDTLSSADPILRGSSAHSQMPDGG